MPDEKEKSPEFTMMIDGSVVRIRFRETESEYDVKAAICDILTDAYAERVERDAVSGE